MIDVKVLRELFRNLQAWQALFESEGIDTITAPDGRDYHLADIEYLYSCRTLLSPRQRQAIELCLFEQVKERDASLAMGIQESNPVAMYASNGLRKLVELANTGCLPRFTPEQAQAVA